MPRSQKALEAFKTEVRELEFSGLYILLAKNKVYVGEAKDLYNRIKTHMANPEEKIKDWDRVIMINDGRPASQSDFNDTVIRRAVEIYLIKLLKANKYSVVSQGESQTLNAQQSTTVNSLIGEFNYFLTKKNIVTKLLEEQGQQLIFSDDVQKLLGKLGRKVTGWTAYEAVIDGQKTFVRPGSKKERGWQITSRGRKPGSFIDSLSKGKGLLLVPRDGLLLIPLTEVQKVITEKDAYKQDTIDIWIVFGDDKVTLRYKKETLDITKYRLLAKF